MSNEEEKEKERQFTAMLYAALEHLEASLVKPNLRGFTRGSSIHKEVEPCMEWLLEAGVVYEKMDGLWFLDRPRLRTALDQPDPKPLPSEALPPDWNTPCLTCGDTPTVPETGMCGPCTFGEADTTGGNW